MFTDRKVCQRAGVFAVALVSGMFLFSGCEKSTLRHAKGKSEEPRFIRYTVSSYRQTARILERLGYTAEAFKKGVAAVPRIELTRISRRWSQEATKIPVEQKKSLFLRLLASGALMANEEVREERQKLFRILGKISREPLSEEESAWLKRTARKYKVLKAGENLTPEKLAKLTRRVDTVPPSLILAQGAIESGWGTSRFAAEGNALFGQWSFSKNALKPKAQRSDLGDYGLASFKTPLDSIRAYILNLNTHPAYQNFRLLRESLRKEGKKPTGILLAPTLEKYSERGEAYIRELLKVIRANRLEWLDAAKLDTNPVISIHPDL